MGSYIGCRGELELGLKLDRWLYVYPYYSEFDGLIYGALVTLWVPLLTAVVHCIHNCMSSLLAFVAIAVAIFISILHGVSSGS